jgi:hypothetical protein
VYKKASDSAQARRDAVQRAFPGPRPKTREEWANFERRAAMKAARKKEREIAAMKQAEERKAAKEARELARKREQEECRKVYAKLIVDRDLDDARSRRKVKHS